MPLFQYEMISSVGKKEKKTLSADCIETAKELLRKQNFLVTKISPISRKNVSIKLSLEQKMNFVRQLSQLLKSGIPLYDSLKIIEEKFNHTKYHFLFVDLCDLVRHGSSFSLALSNYPKTFDPIFLSMIAAGEQSGCLEDVCLELKEMIEKEQKIKKKLSSAMIYPSFLFAFCAVIIFSMFFFFIPSLKELFDGRNLHPLTQTVVNISDFMRAQYLVVVSIVGASGVSIPLLIKSQRGKRFIQKMGIKLPLVKTIVIQSIIVRFSKSMSSLLKSGVPLIDSLNLSKKVTNHYLFVEILDHAIQEMIKGGKLSKELQKHKIFPVLVTKMLATAEESGQFDTIFQNITEIYQEDLEKGIEQFLQLLQPMMILFLGLIVGFVILSIMLPLTDVSSFLN